MDKQKIAIVTGCNGGIGSALSREFNRAGYWVIGTDRQLKAAAECDRYLCCDLTELVNKQAVQEWFYDEVCAFASEQDAIVQAIINNAAVQYVSAVADLSINDFLISHQVNVLAPLVLTKLFMTELRKGEGAVVNIGSIHARLTKPGFCAYSTSKAALSGLTRGLAMELSEDVTVNTILPAATKTEMLLDGFKEQPEKFVELASFHPAGRIAEPEEIARLAVFLCSENARFITGANIAIDGGIGGRLHDPG